MDVTVGIADDVGVMVAPVQRGRAAIAAGVRAGARTGDVAAARQGVVEGRSGATHGDAARGICCSDGVARGRFSHVIECADRKIGNGHTVVGRDGERSGLPRLVRIGQGDGELEVKARIDAFSDSLADGEGAGVRFAVLQFVGHVTGDSLVFDDLVRRSRIVGDIIFVGVLLRHGVGCACGQTFDYERVAALELLHCGTAILEGHGGGGAVLGCVIAAGGAVDLDQEVECGVRVDAFADFLGNGESASVSGDDLAAIGVIGVGDDDSVGLVRGRDLVRDRGRVLTIDLVRGTPIRGIKLRGFRDRPLRADREIAERQRLASLNVIGRDPVRIKGQNDRLRFTASNLAARGDAIIVTQRDLDLIACREAGGDVLRIFERLVDAERAFILFFAAAGIVGIREEQAGRISVEVGVRGSTGFFNHCISGRGDQLVAIAACASCDVERDGVDRLGVGHAVHAALDLADGVGVRSGSVEGQLELV